jgi:predicted metal-dependent peptidase
MSDRKLSEDAAWKSITTILQEHPFYAYILGQMRRVYVPKEKAGKMKVAAISTTAAGKYILILVEEAFHTFPISQQIGILRHEAGHPFVNTWDRALGKNPDLWNIATDMRINVDMTRDAREGRACLPDWVVYPDSDNFKFGLDETCEDYYKKLWDMSPKITLNFDASGGGGEGEKKDKSGEDEDDKGSGQEDGDGGSGKGNITINVQWGSGGDHDIPDEVKDYIRDQLGGDEVTENEQIIKSAARTLLENAINETKSTGRGTVPAGALMALKELEYQSYRFENHFRRWLHKNMGRKYMPTRMRPNRRFATNPGKRRGNGLHLIFIKDTSGSMDLKIRQIMSGHIAQIQKATQARITVIDNDAGYGNEEGLRHYEYEGTRHNHLLLQECGGGGTNFGPAFRFIKEQGWKPSGVLYATDGWAESDLERQPFPVLFCVPVDRGPLSLLNGSDGEYWQDSVLALPPIDHE